MGCTSQRSSLDQFGKAIRQCSLRSSKGICNAPSHSVATGKAVHLAAMRCQHCCCFHFQTEIKWNQCSVCRCCCCHLCPGTVPALQLASTSLHSTHPSSKKRARWVFCCPAPGRGHLGSTVFGGQSVLHTVFSGACIMIAQRMSCVQEYFEVTNHHIVGSLTIPRASIKLL